MDLVSQNGFHPVDSPLEIKVVGNFEPDHLPYPKGRVKGDLLIDESRDAMSNCPR
jgi:hypothetical protein